MVVLSDGADVDELTMEIVMIVVMVLVTLSVWLC